MSETPPKERSSWLWAFMDLPFYAVVTAVGLALVYFFDRYPVENMKTAELFELAVIISFIVFTLVFASVMIWRSRPGAHNKSGDPD